MYVEKVNVDKIAMPTKQFHPPNLAATKCPWYKGMDLRKYRAFKRSFNNRKLCTILALRYTNSLCL